MQTSSAGASLRRHWPEYLMEAGALAAFMISACAFGVLLEHPGSPIHQAIENAFIRNAIGGVAMGLTAVAIIYSPWGQQSGAHMNPAFTLAFFSLGKIERWDAVFYIASQFAGGITGVFVADMLIGMPLRHSAVNYVVTVPGSPGVGVAFIAEAAISGILMTTVLIVSNSRTLSRFTGLFAGALIAIYITVESPLSGMSMNPARTFGSAFLAGDWTAIWIYFTAPLLGMISAGQLYRLREGAHRVFCAKLNHANKHRCIFRCNYGALHVQQ